MSLKEFRSLQKERKGAYRGGQCIEKVGNLLITIRDVYSIFGKMKTFAGTFKLLNAIGMRISRSWRRFLEDRVANISGKAQQPESSQEASQNEDEKS